METDETTPDVQLETPSSEVEQTPADSEVVKTPDDSVPYSRFKEVIEEKNSFKSEIEAMKEQIESLKAKEPEEEPSTWQEVEKRAVEKASLKVREEMKAEADKKNAYDMEIDKSFDRLTKMGQTITPEIRKEVLSTMIHKGTNVYDSYLEIKDKFSKDTRTAQLKEESKTPSSHKGSEETPHWTYKELRSKSLDDIVQNAT